MTDQQTQRAPAADADAGGQVQALVSDLCAWRQDDDGGDTWLSDCGNAFTLNEGDPAENSMKFCCYCGLPLTAVVWEDR
ncbi:MAG: hypothetical protein M3H12_18675 [Chromatiales bacterium]|nr:hypothetical protein [Gammaproteobacteria bacterium]